MFEAANFWWSNSKSDNDKISSRNFSETIVSNKHVPEKQYSSKYEPHIDSYGFKFNGKDSFSDFIIHFEAVADAEKWSDQQKGRILLKSLDGSATSVLGSIPAELRSDYETLKDALNQRYNPRLDSDLAGIIAQSRKRKSSESYLDFSLELKKLVRESYPSWTSDVIETIAREKFFAAIEDPLMRGTLWARQPKMYHA